MDPESESVINVVAVLEGKACAELVSKVIFSGAIVEFSVIRAGWCGHRGARFLPPECVAEFEDILAHEDFEGNGDGVGLTSGEKWQGLEEVE